MTLDDILALKNSENQHKKIALVGLGKENLQFLAWLQNVIKLSPSQIILADFKQIDLGSTDTDLTGFNNNFFGENYLDCLQIPDLEYVFKAPGIWSLKPEFEAFRSVKGRDVICSSLVFFMQKYRDQIIGITGTKGKSTTSALTHQLLNSFDDGNSAIYCGNTTGISPYQFWTSLDQLVLPQQFFVIELSSFQLQDLGYAKISPKYAVITNYFVDHQDQHGSPLEYWRSKDQLFSYQKSGDVTAYTQSVAQNTQNLSSLSSSQNLYLDESQKNEKTKLCAYVKSPLLGQHNQNNLDLAVVIVAAVRLKSAGQIGDTVDICEQIKRHKLKYQKAANKFVGLAHRLELVRQIESETILNLKKIQLQINFYDDGCATEPDAVVAAIEALTQNSNQFLWLQITGKDKGVDLEKLVVAILQKEIENKIFRIDYCGQVGQNLLNSIYQVLGTSQNVPNELFKNTIENSFTNLAQLQNNLATWLQELLNNYQEIGEFAKIHDLLANGKIILNIALSPCGSSFDEFENYTARSQWWLEKLKSLS